MSKKGWVGVCPDWIVEKMKDLELNYRQMGKVVGIDYRNLNKYATGKLEMKDNTKKKIYNAIKLYENE